MSDIDAILGKPVEMLSLETTERRPWIPGARRFLRPGVRAMLFGPRESAKSLVAMVAAKQVVGAGGKVAYLAFENGPRRVAVPQPWHPGARGRRVEKPH